MGGARRRRCTAQTDGRMDALRTQPMYLCLFALFITTCVASVHDAEPAKTSVEDQKLELYDGVYVSFPPENSTGRVLSFEVDTNRSMSEGRSKTKKLMKRILPMFVMPFIIQSALTPFVLGILKFMLIKSFLVGKLALTLLMFNAFRNHNSFKARDSEVANAHYGYHGDAIEHYTTYFNN